MKRLIGLPIELNDSVDGYLKATDRTFAWLARTSIEEFLKSEGHISENREAELFDMIREMIASGHTAEGINKHLRGLERKEVQV